jgi:capsular polysaccharide biosynthesis protein
MEHRPADSPDAQAARELLAGLIEQGRLMDVVGVFEAIQADFPSDPVLATMQAQVYLRLGRNEQAAALAAQALRLDPDDPTAARVLGFAHRIRGNHGEAAKAFMALHRRSPDLTDVASLLMEETAAAHGLDAARPIFEQAFSRSHDRSLAMSWAKVQFAAGRDTGLPAGAVAAEVMSVPAWVARAGQKLDVVGERETTPFQAPPIFGETSEPGPKLNVPGYVIYATSLSGATIFSRSGFILMPDGAILSDAFSDERFGRFMLFPHDKTVVAHKGGRVLLDTGQDPPGEIEAGIMLSGWASDQFGHWVPEYLCRLSYLNRHHRFENLPIIVDAGMPPQHLEFLRLLVDNPIVEIPVGGALKVGELIVASPSTWFPVHMAPGHPVPSQNQGGFSTEGFRFMQGRIEAQFPAPAVHDRKLYMSRKSRSWRRPTNEDEICATLAARGFEIILAEDMTVAEQIMMYQAAEIVVAPNGSALLNAVFAPKDLTLILLQQRGLFNWGTYYALMGELGYDVTFFCTDDHTDQKHSDYSIPIPRLLEAIETLSSKP